jgi:hypothetical protein
MMMGKRNRSPEPKHLRTGPKRESDEKPPTEEDLQPRDAAEAPRETQNPVQPGPELAT